MNRCDHVRHRFSGSEQCIRPPHKEWGHRYSSMPQVSASRAAENRIRRPIVAEMKESQPWCSRCGRTDLRLDPHEPLTRARGGSITDPENIVILCADCHEQVTSHAHEIDDAEKWLRSQFGGVA